MRGEAQGQMVPGLISQGKKFKICFRYNRKSAESSKQRRDTYYLNFLEDGSGCSV